MEPRNAWRTALIGSFAVYLIPLGGPHATSLLGASLVEGLASSRPWIWQCVDISVAVLAQAAAWLMLRWSLIGSAWRKLTWLAAIPLVLGVNFAYLLAIPSFFLIDPDTAAENTPWDEHCFLPDMSLVPVHSSGDPAGAGVRAWWVQRHDGSYALLRLPDCSATEGTIPTPTMQAGGRVDFMVGLLFATSGGVVVVERTVPASAERTWSLLVDPGGPLQPLVTPDRVDRPPIISDRGDVIAWMARIGDAAPARYRVLVHHTSSPSPSPDMAIDLEALGPASFALIDVDAATEELTLWRNDRPTVVGFDGRTRPFAFDPGSVLPQSSTFLRLPTGWLAWDASREDGPYRLAWAIGGRTGAHEINAGRSITSAAVDPTGTLIAISETTSLSIGSAQDVVSAVRTDTGEEVFRKYLPRYSRSHLVFFEGGFLGYSDLQGTHILKIEGLPVGLAR